ncbi:TPA: DUF3265 domain-containing protein [Vibrio vulnificus]|nr:DUF3265 domain-containing protein [Vibrio vulnificus]HDY8016270.1 DUF3265 domain-containing protein [Vibrio vulnificus]
MTKRSSGIHAAWHFWHAVSFGGEGGLRKVGLCGIHPLTRRYVLRGEICSVGLIQFLRNQPKRLSWSQF